jgi:hypothetical protein
MKKGSLVAKLDVEPVVELSLYLDRATLDIIEELRFSRKLKKTQVLRDAMRSVATGKIHSEDVAKFYSDVCVFMLPSTEKEICRFRWPEGLDDTLLKLSVRVLGYKNRSEMMRILVGFEAVRAGIVRVEETKAVQLRILKRAS